MTEERLQMIMEINSEVYDDISCDKQKILDDLYKDPDIFEVLNNKELQERNASPEEYRNVNIYTFLKIPDAQSEVKNYICFDVNDIEESYINEGRIIKQVVFRTVSHQDDVETPYGIDRHDLLALLIKERLQWSNILGMRLRKVYDKGKVAQSGYYYRDIHFQQVSTNGLQRSLMNNRLDDIGRDYYSTDK